MTAFQQPEIMHSAQRWATSRDYPQPPGKGQHGRRFCRWCHLEVPKGRRTFCSERCVEGNWIRVSGQAVRAAVFKRDRGVCAMCGIDAGKMERILVHATRHLCDLCRSNYWMLARTLFDGLDGNWHWQGGCLWQPDHILPVSLGGGMCGLSNYRTLCSPCHLAVTTEQRGDLAKIDRLAKKAARHNERIQQEWAWA